LKKDNTVVPPFLGTGVRVSGARDQSPGFRVQGPGYRAKLSFVISIFRVFVIA